MSIKNRIRRLANTFGIDIMWLHQSSQQTMLGLQSKNIGSIIDCGANEGQFARAMSGVFPKAQLYCYEPLEVAFNKLSAWAQTQNERVYCFNLALGDEEGEVEIHLHDSHTPSSSLLTSTAHCHELYPQTSTESIAKVRLTTLDQAFKGRLEHMPRDILLKLHVQGFEDRVLRGAMGVLAECSACMLEVCLDPLYEGQANFTDLVEILTKAGFKYSGNVDQTYGKDGRVIFFDALFLK
jgi:FkbM family methyltransferase